MAQHRLNYHYLITQSHTTEAGPALANAIVAAQKDVRFKHFAPLRRWYARMRLRRRYFLRAEGTRELGLPFALPWAVPPIVVVSTVRYRVVGRTAAGRRYLTRWGDRCARQVMDRYFGAELPDVGALGR